MTNCYWLGQAFDADAWTYKMSISGPGRNVNIEGKLVPMKRRAEGDLSERPWSMVRECDTMFEGLGGRLENAVGPTALEDSQVPQGSQVLEDYQVPQDSQVLED